MQLQTAIFSGLLAATQCLQVSAGSVDAPILARRGLDVEVQLRNHARSVEDYVEKRQAAAPTNLPALDTAKWNADTERACEKALLTLNGQASNPTGMAVCYNLPYLDNSTGVFEAEVRLYNVSAAINPWVGVKLADIQMTLSYTGASVQMMNMTAAKRDSTVSWPPIKGREAGELVGRQATGTNANAPKPSNELKILNYVGKINNNAMNGVQVQSLLVPTIEVTANSPSAGKPVQAVLSSTEASFVNGVFARAVSNPTASAAAATSDLDPPFKVPGISLGVSPIGLVVTLVWAVLFMGAVGLGTIGRIQFRDQYRRRVKNDQASRINTF